jgi:hypothetical protein
LAETFNNQNKMLSIDYKSPLNCHNGIMTIKENAYKRNLVDASRRKSTFCIGVESLKARGRSASTSKRYNSRLKNYVLI